MITPNFTFGFCRFAYQYKWQQHRQRTQCQPVHGLPTYPESANLRVPLPNSRDDAVLRRLYDKTKNIFESAKTRRFQANTTKREEQTMKALQRLPYVYLPSDKGTEFCVIHKDNYIAAGEKHLQDEMFYKRVNVYNCDAIEKRINAVWSDICRRRKIDYSLQRSFTTRNSDLPQFYHVIKTHKRSTELKIRPIVANIKGPTKRLSRLLVQVLRPLLRFVPAHLESSLELINRIETSCQDSSLSAYKYPCSFDVVALYTSIPIQDAIDNTITMITEQRYQYFCFNADDIRDLLGAVLTNTFFRYQEKQYQQVRGLSMGSSLSGFLAILFLDTIEKRTLQAFPHCPLFARYVDDCFGLVRSESDANDLLTLLNSQHPAIKFELEKPTDGTSLSLLDFTVDMSGDHPTFQFYKKVAKKNLFINAQSSLPNTIKEATIRNEIKRITERSTSDPDKARSLMEFKAMLRLNGYQDQFIERCFLPATRRRRRTGTKCLPIHYLSFSFISDHVERKIKRVFRNEGINIRLYHRRQTLRQVLKKPSLPNICRMKNCPLATKDCLRKMVVYSMQCSCGARYIGSTIRTLHTRVREHFQRETSAVYKHRLHCDGVVSTGILQTAKDPVDLRLREAMKISLEEPSLNDRDEGKDICSLIYF